MAGRDDADFEDFFRADFGPLVAALAVAAGDRESAADAVQEAFVQAHRHWTRISTYESRRAWVRRVATNRILNQRRSAMRRQRAVERMRPTAATDPDGSDRPALAAGLAQLDPRDRLFVCLYYIADLSLTEVADACDTTVNTVRTGLHRARARLSSLIEEVEL